MVTIDQVRDYWNNRPCNIRHSTSPIGTKDYFDEVEARRYANEPHNYTFPEFERWRGLRVLEVGCGIGTDAVNFARNGAIYTGVDLSAESIKLARQRFEVDCRGPARARGARQHIRRHHRPVGVRRPAGHRDRGNPRPDRARGRRRTHLGRGPRGRGARSRRRSTCST